MTIFISIEFGLAVSGGYFIMYKVFSIPEIAIVQSLNQSFMIEFSLNKDNPKKQLSIFIKTVRNLFSIALILYPLIGLLFYYGVGFIFGDQWEPYAIFGLIMIPYFIAQFTMSALYVSLNILNQPNTQLIWDASRFIIIIAIFLFVSIYSLDIIVFISSLAIFTCFFYFLLYDIIKKRIFVRK